MIPTLLVISLLAFIISVNAPGDPADRLLSVAENTSGEASASGGNRKEMKEALIRKMGLDLPLFYIGFGTKAENRLIHSITDNNKRKNLLYIARKSGRPDEVYALNQQLEQLNDSLSILLTKDSLKQYINLSDSVLLKLKSQCEQYASLRDYHLYEEQSDSLLQLINQLPSNWQPELIQKIANNLEIINKHQRRWLVFVPDFSWFGAHNQFHRWIFGDGENTLGIIRGDFGISYRDGQKINDRIGKKVKWSISLAFISIILAYLISLPVGIYAGYRAGGLFDKISGLILFALYSLPGFFVGTLLLVLFANPDMLDWFPESGVKDPAEFNPQWGFLKRIAHYTPYLVLPIITYTYGSFAFISRQMRGGIVDVMKQDFIQTARAKGLKERAVVMSHAFRNALLPIITIFASIFPVAFGGSVIIETIFSIPGMGLEIFESIQNYDYPMIVAIFTIYGFLTVFGYFIGDLMYAAADPRIRPGK